MSHLKIFIELTRFNKPIGFMLLFWPCSWGLAFAYINNPNLNLFFYYLLLFFLGSVLMRSAGCIVNDLVDKDFDIKVQRTKNRPIASKKISFNLAFLYVIILCSLAFIVLIQFNFLTICLGIGSMIPAFLYPYMKRITYWPQLFLGITFNWGIIMAWIATNNSISSEIILLYVSAIFWTLGYDTIYGAQDMSDDEIIGLKSTSIKFKKNLRLFTLICYLVFSALIIFIFKDFLGKNYFSLIIIMFISTLIYQLVQLKKKSKNYLRLFKINNYTGLFLFLAICSINL